MGLCSSCCRRGDRRLGIAALIHAIEEGHGTREDARTTSLESQSFNRRVHGHYTITIQEAEGLPSGLKGAGIACTVLDGRGKVLTTSPVRRDGKWQHTVELSIPDTEALVFRLIADADQSRVLCETALIRATGLDDIHDAAKDFTAKKILQLYKPTTGKKLGHASGLLDVSVRLTKPAPLPGTLGAGTAFEAPRTRHRETRGNAVTLYQSAHIGDAQRAKLAALPDGYHRADCWEDVCSRIMCAEHFIYLSGWALTPSTRLLRERSLTLPNGRVVTPQESAIGELLKAKANEGVVVRILIWNDVTSVSGVLNFEGVAGTGSEQAEDYFRGTKVSCVAAKRHPAPAAYGTSGGAFLFTHHQKAVICDCAAAPQKTGDNAKRGVCAFVGGLDLTNGRWDTPEKSLFDATHFDGDFRNAILPEAETKGGPRQPWQDIHCQVQGPAAHDVLEAFSLRYATQGDKEPLFDVAKLRSRTDDISQERGFAAQLFLSIGNASDSTVQGVVGDCHQGWICAIERAKRFVYIENQYFMGGSFRWKGTNYKTGDPMAPTNRVPVVLANRIAKAIHDGARFMAYVVLPLLPEGDPESATFQHVQQEILFWQGKTVAYMYKRIAEALKAKKSSAHPTDYLSFLCLTKREKPPNPPAGGERLRSVLQHGGRFPIYVHSKMLIVDDEYMIVGSCNINDRSMAGDRDTEIAVGLHQPDRGDKGDVRAFRLSLWSEHLSLTGKIPDNFMDPSTKACADSVSVIAKKAWTQYAANNDAPQMDARLTAYPYTVDTHGHVHALAKAFPDTGGASVMGSDHDLIPDLLTS